MEEKFSSIDRELKLHRDCTQIFRKRLGSWTTQQKVFLTILHIIMTNSFLKGLIGSCILLFVLVIGIKIVIKTALYLLLTHHMYDPIVRYMTLYQQRSHCHICHFNHTVVIVSLIACMCGQ